MKLNGISLGLNRSIGAMNSAPTDTPYNFAVLADNPIAFFPCNETSGPILSRVGSYSGAATGGVTFGAAGPIGDGSSKALKFDGSSGFVTLTAGLSSTLLSGGVWTIEFWCYKGVGIMFAAAVNSGARAIFQQTGAGALPTNSASFGNRSAPNTALTGSRWYHVVLTSTGALYIDGVLQSGTAGVTGTSNVNAMIIGALQTGLANFFNERVSNVALYTSVLSQSRVQAHYQAAVNVSLPSGQSFYWNMATATPNVFLPGSDDTPFFDQSAALSNLDGYNGSPQCLDCSGGQYRCAQFDNPTAYDKWIKKTSGTFQFAFKYSGSITQLMAGQITAKDRSLVDSKEDGVSIKFSSTGATFGIGWNNSAPGYTDTLENNQTVAPDVWHLARATFRATGSPNLRFYLDGVMTEKTSAFDGNFSMSAFHHFLCGNDMPATPTLLRIGEARASGDWDATF